MLLCGIHVTKPTLMVSNDRFWDIFEILNSMNNILEMTVFGLKRHAPIPSHWATPIAGGLSYMKNMTLSPIPMYVPYNPLGYVNHVVLFRDNFAMGVQLHKCLQIIIN